MELRTDDGVVVAQVFDGVMIVKRLESRHKLRRPEGWAFDKSVIQQAEVAGASRIRITCGDTGAIYHTNLTTFLDKAFPFNRGFNEQLVLVMKHWNTGETAEQLTLFGEN